MIKTPPMILLAEDDADDQEFIVLAFKRASTDHKYHITNNGQEVLEYLSGLAEQQLPCLIVLDLNMPVLNGMQTLDELNRLKKYDHIPKVIFTTSDSAEDRAKCLSKGATDYMVKPYDMSGIIRKVETMLDYCR